MIFLSNILFQIWHLTSAYISKYLSFTLAVWDLMPFLHFFQKNMFFILQMAVSNIRYGEGVTKEIGMVSLCNVNPSLVKIYFLKNCWCYQSV